MYFITIVFYTSYITVIKLLFRKKYDWYDFICNWSTRMTTFDSQLPPSSVDSTSKLPVDVLPSTQKDTSTNISFCQRIYEAYFEVIKSFVDCLVKRNYLVTAMVIGTILLEFWSVLKASIFGVANWKTHFNFYNMNPTTLTPEDLTKNPLLLIHGAFGDQSAWLDLGQELQAKNTGPVFTINLPGSEHRTEDDYQLVADKIKEIKALYRKYNVTKIKIDLGGHSKGSELASDMAWSVRKSDDERYWQLSGDIGRVIKIGTPLTQAEYDRIKKIEPNFTQRVLEIIGKYDVLERNPSLLPPSNYVVIPTGHMGLIYASETMQSVSQFLLNPATK